LGPERGGHLIEVKNCHLVYPDGGAYFPDSHSERATKHLRELVHWVHRGGRATVIFCVQRRDAQVVRPSDVHDPAFAQAAGHRGPHRVAGGLDPLRREGAFAPSRRSCIDQRLVPVSCG
jgi:DNA-binding sugar fermentation-stimulating protein